MSIMLHPSAKVILKDPLRPGYVLLIKRNDYYEPAGGKLEVNFEKKTSESLEECVIREAKEELGMSISIDAYAGNYYFFWSIAPNKFSSCTVFIGTVLDEINQFRGNADTCEYNITPEWVLCKDIIEGRMPIDTCFVGLEDLLIRSCMTLVQK